MQAPKYALKCNGRFDGKIILPNLSSSMKIDTSEVRKQQHTFTVALLSSHCSLCIMPDEECC